jgi:hypothetical protein
VEDVVKRAEIIQLAPCMFEATAENGETWKCDKLGAPIIIHGDTAYLCRKHRRWAAAMENEK